MKTEAEITAEILDRIKKSVDISGKEDGRRKIYLLKNGNVAYVRHSDVRYSTNRPRGTYYFVVSIDKFVEYKERFRLILTCGSVDKTLIIPPGDIENLFKNAGISTDNKWYFYVSGDMRLGDIDLSKYLNKWELLNAEKMRLGDDMKDKIRESESRSKICDIVSGFSRGNRKCNHIRLCNDLYAKGFLKHEILEALKYLEENGNIYKIVYVDLYIKDRYKENDLDEGDELLMDTFNAIKDFARRHNWQYGLKKSELCGELLEKGYTKDGINDALTLLEEEKAIYKKFFIYWFTNEYKGCSIDGDCIEGDDYVIYMPDNIEEVEDIDIENAFDRKKVEYPKMEDIGDDGENIYSDVPIKAGSLVKKWKELKDRKEEMEYRRQEEIDLQKELENKREDSINREKELIVKISEVEKEKDILEKLFEPIRLKYDQDSKDNDIKDNKNNKSDQDIKDKEDNKSDQDIKDNKDNKSDQESKKNDIKDNIDKEKTENKEKCISIDATEILSELTNEDIASLLEKKIMWHPVTLETWNSLYIEDIVLDKGDNVVVIDVTRKPWVKQLCCVSDNNDGRVSVTTEITRRHLVHRRCKTPVTIKGDSLHCDKCKQPLPSKPLPNKSVGRWSPLVSDFLKADKFTIGEALINGENGHVVLVDMEHIRRSENDEREWLKSYDK